MPLQDPNFEVAFGMLYAEYRSEHYQWETVIMLRKLGMVVVVVFMGYVSMSIQLLAALGLLTVLGESKHCSGVHRSVCMQACSAAGWKLAGTTFA